MRLKDDLSGPEWQRARNGELFGEEGLGPPLPPLTDDMPMDVWQDLRGRQKMGGGYTTTELGPAGGGGGGTPPQLNVDWTFLGGREGYRRDVYVPNEKGVVIEQSGPTIGKGIDLGQMGPADLRGLNLRPALEAQLSPYLGKKKQDALNFVRAHPLVLSDADLEELYLGVRDREMRQLVEKYDSASKVGRFTDLPRDTQTAIASLYWQYGTSNPAKETPDFWLQITTGDWDAANRNLMKFGDRYGDRRQAEAKLLQRDLATGRLPKPKP